MSSEGDPSEHVAEPILDGEMLSVTDSETEREKEKLHLAIILLELNVVFKVQCVLRLEFEFNTV